MGEIRLNKRDRAIINDLNRFRCLSRDDIIDLYFKNKKNPINCCNDVMKRLRRDGYVEVSTKTQPYIYFPSPSPIKKDSQKIPHFLAIVDVYKQLKTFENPSHLIIEPKYGKGLCEPDLFVIWKREPIFIEVQRSIYSEKVMNEKMERYTAYYNSRSWEKEEWQKADKKVFPKVVILTDSRYNIETEFKVYQVRNVGEIANFFKPKNVMETGGIKFKIG